MRAELCSGWFRTKTPSKRCCLRNGGDETSPGFPGLFGDSEMCDGKVVNRLQSQGNTVFIRINIVNVQHAYFRIRYEQLSSGKLFV